MSRPKRLPADFPPDALMMTFLAMAISHGASTETGELVAHLPSRSAPDGYRDEVIPLEHVDELVRRGWAYYPDATDVEPTERGGYWLGRWCDAKGLRLVTASELARRAR